MKIWFPKDVPFLCVARKGLTTARSLGLFFRNAHAISPPVRTAAFGCEADLREDLRPELGLVAVHDDEPHEPRVHHLEEVLVLEGLGGELESDGALARLLELGVEAQEALVVAARLADEDLLAGQVLGALDGR